MSDDPPPHQPHDKLFKLSFSEPDTAAAFLKTQLPPVLAEGLDWENMKLESGSFIDEEFRASESDLLYQVPYQGGEAFLYLLYEHQRYEDPWLAFRLLLYIVRAWEKFRREHPEAKTLPAVIPVVLAQNATSWKISTHLHDLIPIPEGWESAIFPFLPGFKYRLWQLAEMPMEDFQGTPTGILTLRVLKAEQINALLADIVWDESLHLQVPREMRGAILLYIYHASNVDKEGFQARIEKIKSRQLKENTMTLAQQFRQEGRQEGIQEGRQEGIQEGRQEGRREEGVRLLRRLLQRRFGELPEWVETRLIGGSADDVEQWAERILDASQIEDVFA